MSGGSHQLGWVDPEELVSGLRRDHERVWWLDGRAAQAWSGRTTLVGWLDHDEPSLTWHAAEGVVREHRSGTSLVVGTDPFAALSERIAGGEPGERWVGWFGYGCRTDLPARTDAPAGTGVPDACWLRARRWVELDHRTRGSRAVGFDEPPPLVRLAAAEPRLEPPPPAETVSSWTAARYAAAFAEVQRALRAGHSYEVNLTYRHRVVSALDPWQAFRRQRRVHPAPYAAYVRHGESTLLASSPERFATVSAGTVETRPVKGTAARHPD